MAGPHTARARARAQMLDEIKLLALRQLAEEGAAGLSLRAIARELGVVSSGIYRYYANRDELLTSLILDAYRDLAEAVEGADVDVAATDSRRRFLLRWAALRTWAEAQPARFLLLYGSPVPGYRAPADTIAPAMAVLTALLRVLSAAQVPDAGPADPRLTPQLAVVAAGLEIELAPAVTARAVAGFAELVGLVTLQLGGHFVGAFEPADALVEESLADLADRLGLAAPVAG